MKISFRNFFVVLLTAISFLFLFTVETDAAPIIDFPEYHVEIEIDEDSTFTVRETITNRISAWS
jgi:hypothetical protein